MALAAGGCTLKKTNTAVVVGIYGEGVPHGKRSLSWLVGEYMQIQAATALMTRFHARFPCKGIQTQVAAHGT